MGWGIPPGDTLVEYAHNPAKPTDLQNSWENIGHVSVCTLHRCDYSVLFMYSVGLVSLALLLYGRGAQTPIPLAMLCSRAVPLQALSRAHYPGNLALPRQASPSSLPQLPMQLTRHLSSCRHLHQRRSVLWYFAPPSGCHSVSPRGPRPPRGSVSSRGVRDRGSRGKWQGSPAACLSFFNGAH